MPATLTQTSITIRRQALLTALQRVGRVADQRTAKPVLRCVRLEATNGELVQQRGGATGAEGRLRSPATQAREIGSFALLQQDNENEKEAGEDVNQVQNVDQRSASRLWSIKRPSRNGE